MDGQAAGPSGRAPRWTPGQYRDVEGTDLRRLVGKQLGPRPTKRRREDEDDVEEEHEDMAIDEEARTARPLTVKRQKADNSTWRPVTGKTWKAGSQRAAVIMKPKSNKTWEKRMQDKAAKQQLQVLKKEALDTVKAKRKAIADQKKAAKERKMANRKKNEVVQQVSTATAKKMMKNRKQMKVLRTGDGK